MKLEKLVYDDINATTKKESELPKNIKISVSPETINFEATERCATLVITPIYVGNKSRIIYQCRNCGVKITGVDNLYDDGTFKYCMKCGARFMKEEYNKPQYIPPI